VVGHVVALFAFDDPLGFVVRVGSGENRIILVFKVNGR
jgi:hypothetical protein